MKRRNHQARRGAISNLPAWMWLVSGVLIGLILAAVVIYGGMAPGLRPQPEQPQPQATTPAAGNGEATGTTATGTTTGDNGRRYDFYTVLPEMEVLIPDSELQAQVRAETPPPSSTGAPATTAPPSGQRYRLQAGSYRDPRPAEEAKARLALLGISASVQSVNINGMTYHRVYVGPYTSAAEVERVKQQLAANGVPAIAVREATP